MSRGVLFSLGFCLFFVTLVGVVGWACLCWGLLPLPRFSLRFVCWSRLRRPTFQRWKVGKDRRAAARTRGWGAAVEIRSLQILWLLPAVSASALNTSAIGPSGGYPPCKTCGQFRWRGWSTCRLSDCQPLQDGFGVESIGGWFRAFSFFHTLSAFNAFRTCRAFIAFKVFTAFSFTQNSIKMWKTSANISAPTQHKAIL